MSENKKGAPLPMFLGRAARPERPAPKVHDARAALGGRASSSALAGTLVTVTSPAGATRPGAVVFADEASVDVWVGDGRIRRVRHADVTVAHELGEHPLAAVAADARVFASLVEGTTVRFLSPVGITLEGTLAEKCRYGALVLAADGKLLAVSFRRLFPAVSGAAS